MNTHVTERLVLRRSNRIKKTPTKQEQRKLPEGRLPTGMVHGVCRVQESRARVSCAPYSAADVVEAVACREGLKV